MVDGCRRILDIVSKEMPHIFSCVLKLWILISVFMRFLDRCLASCYRMEVRVASGCLGSDVVSFQHSFLYDQSSRSNSAVNERNSNTPTTSQHHTWPYFRSQNKTSRSNQVKASEYLLTLPSCSTKTRSQGRCCGISGRIRAQQSISLSSHMPIL